MCRWRATYYSKDLNKGYNFALNLTSPQLEVCTQSYGPPKSRKSQFREFRDSNFRVPGQNDIWVLVLWPGTENSIRGEGGGFPQVWVVMNLVSSCLPVAHLCTKTAPTMH